MVCNYIRKTTTKYSQKTLEKCLSCVRKGKMLMKNASRHFNVSYGTIRKSTIFIRKLQVDKQPYIF